MNPIRHSTVAVTEPKPAPRHLRAIPWTVVAMLACGPSLAAESVSKGIPTPQPIDVSAINVGPIPDGGNGGCGFPGPALDVQFVVPAFPGYIVDDVDVSLSFGPPHTFAGDVKAVLVSPDGRRRRTLFGYTGVTTTGGCGDGSDLLGPYVFSDAASPPSGGWWQAATEATNEAPIASGSYLPTDAGRYGAVNPMPGTGMARIFADMNSTQAAGIWHLYVTDAAANDTGTVQSASLRLTLRAPTVDRVVYSNGVIETGTVSGNGIAAPAGKMWSELQRQPDGPMDISNANGFSARASDGRKLADDFVVPSGQTWRLTGVAFLSYVTDAPASPSPFASTTLRVWRGEPGAAGSQLLCGDDETNRLVESVLTPLLRIPNAFTGLPQTPNRTVWRNVVSIAGECDAVQFGPGTYWVDWSSTAVDNKPHFYPPNTYIDARTLPGDNAREFADGSWGAALDEGFQTDSPDVPIDFPFQLLGTIGLPSPELFKDGFETPIN